MSIISNDNIVSNLATFTINLNPQTVILNGSQIYFSFPIWTQLSKYMYYSNYTC
jgi:hypothetical protein